MPVDVGQFVVWPDGQIVAEFSPVEHVVLGGMHVKGVVQMLESQLDAWVVTVGQFVV